MLTVKTTGAVVGVAITEYRLAAVSAEKIFPDFNKMLRHLLIIYFNAMIHFIENLIKDFDPQGWRRGVAQKYVTEAKP